MTVVAGLGPALRATRVSPVTAMREGADIPPGRIGRRAPLFAAITGVLALAVLGLGLFGPGIDAEAAWRCSRPARCSCSSPWR